MVEDRDVPLLARYLFAYSHIPGEETGVIRCVLQKDR